MSWALQAASTRRPTGWAADLRFRQKASLLRIGGTADFAGDLLDNGQQVAISVAFLETSAMLAEKLRGLGWSVGEINGQMTGDANEATRVAFQTGELDVVIFTVTESISLHRGEMQGGERDGRWSSTTCATAPSSSSRSRAAATATASGP